jgi:hypothetical protein
MGRGNREKTRNYQSAALWACSMSQWVNDGCDRKRDPFGVFEAPIGVPLAAREKVDDMSQATVPFVSRNFVP